MNVLVVRAKIMVHVQTTSTHTHVHVKKDTPVAIAKQVRKLKPSSQRITFFFL